MKQKIIQNLINTIDDTDVTNDLNFSSDGIRIAEKLWIKVASDGVDFYEIILTTDTGLTESIEDSPMFDQLVRSIGKVNLTRKIYLEEKATEAFYGLLANFGMEK